MNSRLAFDRARRELAFAHERNTNLCDPFVALFPVSGAALSLLASGPVGQETVCASDSIAARIDELQFDLGEGPCWDAMASRRPVLREDLASTARQDWPAFGEAIAADETTSGVASVFAFPLAVGSLDIGALDLYSAQRAILDHDQVTDATSLASLAAWQVLRKVLGDQLDDDTGYSRREVHQATGMLIAQLDVSAEDATLLLRAHAFATGRSVRDLANDIVARRIDFSTDGRDGLPTVK